MLPEERQKLIDAKAERLAQVQVKPKTEATQEVSIVENKPTPTRRKRKTK